MHIHKARTRSSSPAEVGAYVVRQDAALAPVSGERAREAAALRRRRIGFIGLNAVTVGLLFAAMAYLLGIGGLKSLEWVMLFAFSLTLPWLSIGFWNALIGFVLAFWHVRGLSRELVRSAALDSASQYADMLEVVNELYSDDVVEKLGSHDVEVTADYARREGAIPLPATLLTELLGRIEEHGSGMHGRHFSAYPYPFRVGGGPHDDFEHAALAALTAAPTEPFYRYGEDAAGRPVLRYARARIMGPSCIACHNYRPDSPKTDWQVGDMRGVLEVVRLLDRDEERIRAGLRGSFFLIGAGGALMLALGLLLHWWGERQRRLLVQGGPG